MNLGFLILLLLGVSVITLAFFKFKNLDSGNPFDISLFGIWLIGLTSFLFGLVWTWWGMAQSFEAIEVIGDVSPSLVAGKIKESIVYGITGLSILIGSLILWGIVKRKKNLKILIWENSNPGLID